jgi:glycerol-3-phosphate dehydrogenase
VPLCARGRTALAYSDCQVDDARLVVLNAVDAAARGATIRTRTRCTHAERGAVWRLTLESRGKSEQATATVLVNAAGPWLEAVRDVIGDHAPPRTRLVKGSHVVMRRLYDGDHAYVLQADDGRIVFMLPFADDFTLIGTTDVDFRGDPATVAPSADEIAYLCRVVDTSFRAPIGPQDVVWSFAGVRSLYDDGAGSAKDVTRDFHLALDTESGAPLLSVYGGKITTFRVLAEAALAQLRDVLPPMTSAWTKTAALPGGDFAYAERDARIVEAQRAWPFLGARQVRRLVGYYGTRIGLVLGDARSAADLGTVFGEDLSEAEVRYLVAQEWAETADDILWRRTKLGLRVTASETQRLSAFLANLVPTTGR